MQIMLTTMTERCEVVVVPRKYLAISTKKRMNDAPPHCATPTRLKCSMHRFSLRNQICDRNIMRKRLNNADSINGNNYVIEFQKKKNRQTKLELAIVSIVWRWTCTTVNVEKHKVK